MFETVRYADGDLEEVLIRMMDFERMIEELMIKTHKQVTIETEIRYYMEDDIWEGLVILTDAKADR